jgi:O-methyltransferase
MKKINHPVGNVKILILKRFSIILNRILIFVISLFLKIKKDESEIIISNAFYAPWKKDINFIKIYEKIKNYTLLDVRRLYTLWYLMNQLKNTNGNILDIGCLMGGAGFLISKINKKGKIFLIDTFKGYIDQENFYSKNSFVFEDVNFVKKKIRELKLNNVEVCKGIFPNNFEKKFAKTKFKFCHIDLNTFNSTKKSFYYLDKKIIKGGILIFDDFGMFGADGIKKFILENQKYLENKYKLIFNFQGQCILIKR